MEWYTKQRGLFFQNCSSNHLDTTGRNQVQEAASRFRVPLSSRLVHKYIMYDEQCSDKRGFDESLWYNTPSKSWPFTKWQNLDWSKLKACADDKINITENLKYVFERQKTMWEKEKMLGTSIFLFSLNVFKRLFYSGSLKKGIVW